MATLPKSTPTRTTPATVQSAVKAAAKAIPLKPARVKAAVKVAVKPAPVVAKAAKAAKPKPAPKAKVKKPKLVRDSFTIPKPEYLILDVLKARANQLASPAKKGELLRAGIKALAAMSDAAFLLALKAVPAIKTGRPVNV